MQDICASLVGRLVKDSNTDLRKAIRSISQGDAVPLTIEIVYWPPFKTNIPVLYSENYRHQHIL